MMKQAGKCRAPVLAAAVLLAAQIFAPAVAAAEKIVSIGFAGPLSGLSNASGLSMLNAVQMAVDDVNSAGLRIGGDKLTLKLLVQDDRSNPRIGEVAARYFVRSGVAGVVGIFNSAVAVSSSAFYQKAGIPHFAVAGARRFTLQGHDTAFRFAAYDEERAQVLAAFTVHELRKCRAAIVHDDSVFGRGYKERFENAFITQGGKVVGVHAVSASAVEFNDILKSVGASKADVVFFGGLASQSATLAQNMSRLRVPAILVTAASLVGPLYLQAAGPAAEGTVSAMPGAHLRKSRQMENFEKNYLQRYKAAAGPYSAIAYDQVQVLAAAIARAGSASPRKVNTALHAIRYNGLTGPVSFDRYGDLRELNFSVYQVRSHAWILNKQYSVGAGGKHALPEERGNAIHFP